MVTRTENWENYRVGKKALKALELKLRSEIPRKRGGWTKKMVIKVRG